MEEREEREESQIGSKYDCHMICMMSLHDVSVLCTLSGRLTLASLSKTNTKEERRERMR